MRPEPNRGAEHRAMAQRYPQWHGAEVSWRVEGWRGALLLPPSLRTDRGDVRRPRAAVQRAGARPVALLRAAGPWSASAASGQSPTCPNSCKSKVSSIASFFSTVWTAQCHIIVLLSKGVRKHLFVPVYLTKSQALQLFKKSTIDAKT